MKRFFIFIFFSFFYQFIFGQAPYETKIDSIGCRDRKNRKVKTVFLIEQNYDTATSKFNPINKRDTSGYYVYDKEGREVESLSNFEDGFHSWKFYNEKGLLIKSMQCKRDSSYARISVYQYDSLNRFVKEEKISRENGKDSIYEYTVLTYGKDSRPLVQTRFQLGYSPTSPKDYALTQTTNFTYVLSDTGYCIYSATVDNYNSNNSSLDSVFYNTQGKIIKTVNKQYCIRWYYDSNGNNTSIRCITFPFEGKTTTNETEVRYTYKRGKLIEITDIRQRSKYEYDKRGKIKATYNYSLSGVLEERITYSETYFH